MDNEFDSSVSPEMAQVKAAAKAFFDSMELYMGAIQQLEDEIKRLQITEEVRYGKPLIQYNETEEQLLTIKDAREYIAAHGVHLLTEGLDKTGKRVRWSDSQIAVIYQSIYAQVQAIAGVQVDLRGQGLTAEDIARAELTFGEFFPEVTIILSSAGHPTKGEAALTKSPQDVTNPVIYIWNTGITNWPSEDLETADENERSVNIFSPELITHEFGHVLNYFWGRQKLQNTFEDPYIGNPSAILTDPTNNVRIPIWNPFPSGSPSQGDVRTTGRMYGGRWDPNVMVALGYAANVQEATSKVNDERTAEAYAVWVLNQYNYQAGHLIDIERTNLTITELIEMQKTFWYYLFSGRLGPEDREIAEGIFSIP